MRKVNYSIHHQAMADCPDCEEMVVVDLGEFGDADGIEMKCSECDCEFELEGANE